MYTPMSRNHFLKVANGKSDHATLSKANARKKARAEFCLTKLRHWNERETRIANAASSQEQKDRAVQWVSLLQGLGSSPP